MEEQKEQINLSLDNHKQLNMLERNFKKNLSLQGYPPLEIEFYSELYHNKNLSLAEVDSIRILALLGIPFTETYDVWKKYKTNHTIEELTKVVLANEILVKQEPEQVPIPSLYQKQTLDRMCENHRIIKQELSHLQLELEEFRATNGIMQKQLKERCEEIKEAVFLLREPPEELQSIAKEPEEGTPQKEVLPVETPKDPPKKGSFGVFVVDAWKRKKEQGYREQLFEIMEEQRFTTEQLEEIEAGIASGLSYADILKYANAAIPVLGMKNIRCICQRKENGNDRIRTD
ncbi:MAG: hypothetical protein RR678_10720 [Lachnospiraceae bacterium]